VKVAKKRKPTIDAIEIIHRRYYEGHPQRIAELADAEAKDAVARKTYARQKQTAEPGKS
jgi:hypothetical protein